MTQIDPRNYQVTIAIVDQYGELVAQKEFSHIIPPREPRTKDNEKAFVRP